MAKKKGKKFGSRGFTVESNPGAVAAQLDANEKLAFRVSVVRNRMGKPPDSNFYIPLSEGESK